MSFKNMIKSSSTFLLLASFLFSGASALAADGLPPQSNEPLKLKMDNNLDLSRLKSSPKTSNVDTKKTTLSITGSASVSTKSKKHKKRKKHRMKSQFKTQAQTPAPTQIPKAKSVKSFTGPVAEVIRCRALDSDRFNPIRAMQTADAARKSAFLNTTAFLNLKLDRATSTVKMDFATMLLRIKSIDPKSQQMDIQDLEPSLVLRSSLFDVELEKKELIEDYNKNTILRVQYLLKKSTTDVSFLGDDSENVDNVYRLTFYTAKTGATSFDPQALTSKWQVGHAQLELAKKTDESLAPNIKITFTCDFRFVPKK